MTTRYLSEERREQMLFDAYGPFQPGSMARATRWENWQRGLHTCWRSDCLKAYKPRRLVDDRGRRHRPGRGRWYCSRTCADADRFERSLWRAITAPAGGEQRVRDFGCLPEAVA